MAEIIRGGFSGEKGGVTLRLVEDENGKRLALPDGRYIKGVVAVDVSVSPHELSSLTVRLVDFEVDMGCPTQKRKEDGDR